MFNCQVKKEATIAFNVRISSLFIISIPLLGPHRLDFLQKAQLQKLGCFLRQAVGNKIRSLI
jgi:hypothetical protein